MRQQSNYTCMLKNLLKQYCILTWDTLWWFFCFVLFFSPWMRQLQNYFWDTISRIGGWGTKTKIIKTETLLHLNLEILKFYLFIYLFIYFSQSSLCLSNACSAYCCLVHYLFMFILLKLLFFFFYLFFPLSLTSLVSLSSYPSILNITIVIITS
jgi:hypothetical protein